MTSYDIAIIGGGPGGYVAAIKAAQYGKRVCLLEKAKLGGVCLNQGCIPTKALIESVEVLKTVRRCQDYGIAGVDNSRAAVDMTKLQQRKQQVVQQLTGGVAALLKANGVKVLQGEASFIDQNTIKIGSEQVTAENIIIATGSKPASLPIPISGGDNCPCHAPCTTRDTCTTIITSQEALELNEIPSSLVIIGGGVIGVEFAYIYAHMGSQVTILEMLEHILPMVDTEITAQAAKMLRGLGVKILTGARVTRIDGNKVSYTHAGQAQVIETSKILVATGRVPNTDALNLEVLGLAMDRKAIAVDNQLRTNIPGIYAIGDVNGNSMLAHTASMEGLIAVENILGKEHYMDYAQIPACIYVHPEIAAVGLTEQQARAAYGEVKVGRFPLAANGKALVEGETKGLIKVILEANYHEILGVHIYGAHATEMIAEIAAAMKLEATAEEIIFSVHPHPTVSEVIPEAFHAALDKAIHAL